VTLSLLVLLLQFDKREVRQQHAHLYTLPLKMLIRRQYSRRLLEVFFL